MRFLALFCSVILHPLILLNIGLFSLLKFHPYYQSKFYDEQFYTISMFIAVNTILMPFLSVYLLKRFKIIDSLYMENPKQRFFPYIIMALLLGFTAYELFKNDFTGLPLIFLLSTILCVLLNVVINFKFTISSHAIGAGGLLGLFVFLTLFQHVSVFNWFLVVAILVAGVSGWARLSLNAHSEKQLYLGYLLGLAVVIPVCCVFA